MNLLFKWRFVLCTITSIVVCLVFLGKGLMFIVAKSWINDCNCHTFIGGWDEFKTNSNLKVVCNPSASI